MKRLGHVLYFLGYVVAALFEIATLVAVGFIVWNSAYGEGFHIAQVILPVVLAILGGLAWLAGGLCLYLFAEE